MRLGRRSQQSGDAPEGDSERPGAGAVTPQPVSAEHRVNPEAAKEMTELRPSYDLKQIVRKLRDPNVPLSEKERLLLSMHERFWHASAP